MIGSLMYLTASRPDIMYAVCVCSRFQVTPKTSHLNAVKRIFKYLKGKPNLGLWYPRDSPLDLEAFSDSDYGGSNLDRKSTTGGCQFLGQRLISWQCKKQTIVATSTTEAEYVAAANCCGQVLWVQNQLLDYGFNFMNTKIHIDNESTICIVKNPVYHSKTKHIEIRHHFIRDCYEKKLISVEKIHTDLNVADLLTKPFDGPRFHYLVVSIGLVLVLLGVEKGDARSTWTWKTKCQLSLANWMQFGCFLLKPTESAGYTEIVDFLRRSKLRYALTHNPPIYDSLVKQFSQTATARTLEDGIQQLNTTIDSIEYTITEESVRRQLQLADASGINMLQNEEIFVGLQNIGYVNDRTFTFWKSHFTPQWRFLVHHILHCISSKSGGWDQFGSNIATALICLSTGRDFNFSKLIFDGMISNLKSKSKFLMYPRFLQMILNVQTENKNLFVPVSLTKKIFGNMKRGFQGIHRPLLPVMLTIDAGQPQPSADPTPSQSVPATSSSHVQITQPPPTLTHSVQPPPQPSSVQPTATTPPTQPVQTTSPPPVSSIPDIQPTQPPSPQIPSPSFHDTEGPSFEPSYHMSPPPSHEPEIQASRSSEESEQLRNLMDIVPRLESRVKSLEKELSETKQTLGTAILQLIEKVKKLENKLRKKRKSKETKDAQGQDQDVPSQTDQGDTFATPEKSKGSGEAQEEQISPSTLEAAQILSNVASEGFKGSQAPLGSKIYRRKPKSTTTPTKILHFEEPDSAQVNTAQVNTAELNADSTPSAQVNTGETERVQRRKGKEPMTEEDLQAEVQASKKSKELQELADLEEAQRLQAKMDAETQRQIDLDALLARRLVEQEEEAAKEALATEFDYIQARLNADQILAEKIQQEEREQYSIEDRAKFLHDTIAAQRKFLAEQRSAAIKNKPPTISQLRNQMITYLKHVANKKHAELKSKSFEEIQVLYERYKKQDQTFVAIGSEEDERAIKKMNEKDADKEEEKKDESVHEEVQEEEGAKKRKLGTRRKLKAKRRKHASSLTREDDDLKICLHIAPDEDKVIDAESLDHQYPIIEWQSFFLTTKPQYDQTKPDEDIYLNKVTRSNGHQRFFRTLMGVLSILDREDLKVIYELVMEEYKDKLPEGFDKMLWGDLMIMFNQGDTADFWDTQQNWKLISWKLHSSSGVHTIMTSTGLVIHMFVENRYPLAKEVLSQMLELKLETEEESTMALELIKFVKQQLEEFEDSNDDDLVTSDHEEAERSKRLAGKELSNPFIADDLLKIIWLLQKNCCNLDLEKVWILVVDLPYRKKAIGTKWGFEAIRIFLAFASYIGFIVYQMDVKSAFLYGKIDEEVYVSQPLVDIERGTIDKTLFTKKDKNNIMLVQVYVDDIIFGSTKKSWCDEFEVLMKSRFQMSSMGELTFFLGLQVKQKEDDWLAHPIEDHKPLVKVRKASDVHGFQNPVFHSKTKHIAIRHHFIRDAYEKKLIQVLKIHTDDNVADLLTKAFDVNSYLGFRESLERDIDGTEELLLPDLFILWLTKVSTDSAKLIPLGKDSTAIKTLEKIPPRV
ncbi:putative ribonuclease H-like domain-containing protein [Tanacetum coccineum]